MDTPKIEFFKTVEGSNIYIIRGWLDTKRVDDLLRDIRQQILFVVYKDKAYAKEFTVPRGMAFLANSDIANVDLQGQHKPGIGYRYGNNTYPTLQWETPIDVLTKTDILEKYPNAIESHVVDPVKPEGKPVGHTIKRIMDHINASQNYSFNSVLVNEYPTGRHYIAYHPDREALGRNNAVYGLSLGGRRDFYFQGIKGTPAEGEMIKTYVEHGDLMIMSGTTQLNYKHSVPKRAHGDYRISLTFRELK